MKNQDESAHRAIARGFAKHGIAEFARAFNHCHNPKIGYRYSTAVQRRFVELGAELVALVESGEIVSRTTMAAEEDAVFQRHMSALVGLAGAVTQKPPALPAERANEPDAIFTRADIAERLKCTTDAVRKWIKAGKLPPPDVALSRKTTGWKRSTLAAAGIDI